MGSIRARSSRFRHRHRSRSCGPPWCGGPSRTCSCRTRPVREVPAAPAGSRSAAIGSSPPPTLARTGTCRVPGIHSAGSWSDLDWLTLSVTATSVRGSPTSSAYRGPGAGGPPAGAGVPCLGERDRMVDVHVGGLGPHLAVVVGPPLAGGDFAARHLGHRLDVEHLVATPRPSSGWSS
jgi:hypothetical protein